MRRLVMTTRRWMLTIAVVAIFLGLFVKRRSDNFRSRAFEWLVAKGVVWTPLAILSGERWWLAGSPACQAPLPMMVCSYATKLNAHHLAAACASSKRCINVPPIDPGKSARRNMGTSSVNRVRSNGKTVVELGRACRPGRGAFMIIYLNDWHADFPRAGTNERFNAGLSVRFDSA